MIANWFKLKPKLELYNSIETMPVAIWFKINDTGALKHLIKQGVCNDVNVLIATWGDVYAQFIDYIGINGTFDNLLKLKKRKALLELDLVITDNEFLRNKLSMIEDDIHAIESKQVNPNYLDSKIMVERAMGFRLDINVVSVKEFYSYIKNLENNGTK
jgi:hypothetical protein